MEYPHSHYRPRIPKLMPQLLLPILLIIYLLTSPSSVVVAAPLTSLKTDQQQSSPPISSPPSPSPSPSSSPSSPSRNFNDSVFPIYHSDHMKCDRDLARKVRQIIQNDIYSQFTSVSSALSYWNYLSTLPSPYSLCPLSPLLDLTLSDDQQRERSRGQWKCTKCDKLFKSEGILDWHKEKIHINMDKDNKENNNIPNEENDSDNDNNDDDDDDDDDRYVSLPLPTSPSDKICFSSLCQLFDCWNREPKGYIEAKVAISPYPSSPSSPSPSSPSPPRVSRKSSRDFQADRLASKQRERERKEKERATDAQVGSHFTFHCNVENVKKMRVKCEEMANQCFPMDKLSENNMNFEWNKRDISSIRQIFFTEFCDYLSCDPTTHQHLGRIKLTEMKNSSKSNRLKYVFGGIFLTLIVIYYVIVWIANTDKLNGNDRRYGYGNGGGMGHYGKLGAGTGEGAGVNIKLLYQKGMRDERRSNENGVMGKAKRFLGSLNLFGKPKKKGE